MPLIARYKASEVLQPSKEPLDLPPTTMPTELPPGLRFVSPRRAVGRDELDPALGKYARRWTD